ncbi:hypothetical protein A6A08_10900 [Nocardiopsis sp. TSRI0078]|uniref:SRPBCC family protein n=1 Tax=unclassified Nocardiopsis TaxID=2649073 RepID=UPI00093CD6D9|nr:SRPBCC domain-containing protein [Nocardiopsis sp. TSRI0078]OKI15036.1 hypothetical protein A6A08_10900 [Nocardiopsis sp. TSRI0078]
MEEHDLAPGGVAYVMTGPEGDGHHGWWKVVSVDPPTSLEFVDGFSDQDGAPSAGMPSATARVETTGDGDGNRMVLRSVLASLEQREQLARMGMVEGLEQSVGQMDALPTG